VGVSPGSCFARRGMDGPPAPGWGRRRWLSATTLLVDGESSRLGRGSAAANWVDPSRGDTALTRAARAGDVAALSEALEVRGVDVNCPGRDGGTPLAVASIGGHVEAVAMLLAVPGIDVNRANPHGQTALHGAALTGRCAVVAQLLAAPGTDVNAADALGRTALHKAARGGHWDVVEALVGAPGVDVGMADQGGDTPCAVAKAEGWAYVAEILEAAERRAKYVVQAKNEETSREFRSRAMEALGPGPECGVCMEPLDGASAAVLPCAHVLCAACFPRLRTPACPFCREPWG